MDWLNTFSQTPEIVLDERIVPIAIKRHPTAKRLTLRLAPDGSEVRVTMPRWAQSREATAFARSRQAWLETQLASILPISRPRPGSQIPFRGRLLTIDWDRTFARSTVVVGDRIAIGGPADSLIPRLERWLRVRATTTMERDLNHYCTQADVATPALALSRAKRRWGSCSTTGTVRINWRLIMAPDAIRRSVVAHEVAHLVHFDHSPIFHRLLGDIYEGEIAAANHWLKTHGRALYGHFG